MPHQRRSLWFGLLLVLAAASSEALALGKAPLPDGFETRPQHGFANGLYVKAHGYDDDAEPPAALRDATARCEARNTTLRIYGDVDLLKKSEYWLYRSQGQEVLFSRSYDIRANVDTCVAEIYEKRSIKRGALAAEGREEGEWPGRFESNLECGADSHCKSRRIVGVSAGCSGTSGLVGDSSCVSTERGSTRGMAVHDVFWTDDGQWHEFKVDELRRDARISRSVFDVSLEWPAPPPPPHEWVIPSDAAISAMLAQRMAHNGVGAVVGVIDASGRRRIVSFGRSDAADERSLDGDTVFQMGSLSKPFVGLLLADMVRRGEVALDDPAQKYLPPGVTMPERGRPITLRDLSTHRSGLPSMPDNFRLDADPNPIEAYRVEDLWRFLSSYSLTREPGVKYEYSNLAVSLLGRLLARRAGKEYETLLNERVLRPLGMRSSAMTVSRSMARRLTPGHNPYLQPVQEWEMKTLQASGSLRSTANDMLRFVGGYLGKAPVPLADSMALQLRTHSPQDGNLALGWFVDEFEGRQVYSHEGSKWGYRTGVAFDPKTHTGVVVLQNARTEDHPHILAIHLLTGRPLPPALKAPAEKRLQPLAPEILERYAGRYRAKDGIVQVISKRDRLLVAYTPGSAGLEFLPTGVRDFFYHVGNDDITFELDDGDRVTGMRIYGDGKEAGTFELAPRL
jgi:D-alanyl-D-alanine-carboxypeptidase/D-alanyl-D-alanine-endopeptidase